LVVLKFGFGREAEKLITTKYERITECYTGSRIWTEEIRSDFRWGKPVGLWLLRKPRFPREDNIKMDLKGIGRYSSGIG